MIRASILESHNYDQCPVSLQVVNVIDLDAHTDTDTALLLLSQLAAIYGHCYFDQHLLLRCNMFLLAVIFSAVLERCE